MKTRNFAITMGVYWILLSIRNFIPEPWYTYCTIGLIFVAFIAAYQMLRIILWILETK